MKIIERKYSSTEDIIEIYDEEENIYSRYVYVINGKKMLLTERYVDDEELGLEMEDIVKLVKVSDSEVADVKNPEDFDVSKLPPYMREW